MITIQNSSTADITTVQYEGSLYGSDTNPLLPAGGKLEIPSEQIDFAHWLVETYGFLTMEIVEDPNAKYTCDKCGQTFKIKIALLGHKKKCDGKGEIIELPTNPTVSTIKKTRSDLEAEGFGNTDLAGVTNGQVVMKKIGGRVQPVQTDRDGVDWYGPGVENDFVPIKKPGSF